MRIQVLSAVVSVVEGPEMASIESLMAAVEKAGYRAIASGDGESAPEVLTP